MTGGSPEHWSAPPRSVDFFDAKGAVQLLAEALGVEPTYEADAIPFFVAGQSAAVILDGERVGVVGQVDAAIVERAGAPRQDAVFVAELDLDRIAARAGAASEFVRPLPRYPSVVRDLSIAIWRLFCDVDLSDAGRSRFRSMRDCFTRELKEHFKTVKTIKPKASRAESREIYLLARSFGM